jgi:outer membrane beta-barrel protein
MMMHRLLTSTLIVALAVPQDAVAHHGSDSPLIDGIVQEDDSDEGEEEESLDDFLDDLLNEDTTEKSVKQEREEVMQEDAVSVDESSDVVLPGEELERRIIKTLQRKNFLKLGRFEWTPNVAFVANDPFLNRYIVGSGLSYHLTEIFAVEVNLGFSPDLGDADWKPLTDQLVNNNHVSPDISKLTYFGNTTFCFSPIYGKAAVLGRKIITFDIFGAFGMGMTRTVDDLEALQKVDDPVAQATQFQIHPTTNFGGGARIIFNERTAIRIEGRSLIYIETVDSTTLEMKNNFIVQAGVSLFWPGMP